MKYALLMASNPQLGVLFAQETSRLHSFSHLVMVKRKSQIATASRRVFIARDPARRIVSGFLSKFVLTPETTITQTICNFAELSADEMNFRTYVKTLSNMPDVYLDPHFRSQEDFLVMPIEDYQVVSLDNEQSLTYDGILNDIYPGSSERYFALSEAHEFARLGPVVDRDRIIVPERLSEAPVKHLRYLRANGSSLPREEFIFAGFEEIVRQRYDFDYQINAMATTSAASV